jgi:hypothetical protein
MLEDSRVLGGVRPTYVRRVVDYQAGRNALADAVADLLAAYGETSGRTDFLAFASVFRRR